MLVDVDLLLYAVVAGIPEHAPAKSWLQEQLNGDSRVGMPWESLTGFLRLSTNPRVVERPLAAQAAWAIVEDWLAAPVAWVPLATDRHADVFGALVTRYRPTGKLVADAHLVALAIEHGLDICSSDTDFARFSEIRWINPLADTTS